MSVASFLVSGSMGSPVWIAVYSIQILRTTSLFSEYQNQYSKRLLLRDLQFFDINYYFTRLGASFIHTMTETD